MLGQALIRLSASQVARQLPAWSLSASSLQRDYKFESLSQASEFMKLVTQLGANYKEAPLCKSNFSTVSVTLEAQRMGLTRHHMSLARFIDKAEEEIKIEAEV